VSSVTPAIQKAAESAKKKLIQVAIRDKESPFFGMKLEEVSYRDGELTGGGKSTDFGAVLSTMGRGSVQAIESAAAGEEEESTPFTPSVLSFAN
jgi:xanthine dehydrogenase YagR molybdenum-binding subunit